jgi:Rrf2 family transcriptional regulator, nitric oxide-sensitive transcriptional repressor
MELSRFTDYSLRTLLFAGLHPDRILTVPEVANAYGISENHLVKVTHKLGKLGYLETRRGRSGGFRLSREPEAINLGEVVRATESLALVECLGSDGGRCPIVRACILKRVIAEARDAFLETFDRYTLQDMIRPRDALLNSFI